MPCLRRSNPLILNNTLRWASLALKIVVIDPFDDVGLRGADANIEIDHQFGEFSTIYQDDLCID